MRRAVEPGEWGGGMGRLAWRGGAGVGVVEGRDEGDARRLEGVVGREA
jgi:hypothetical protein